MHLQSGTYAADVASGTDISGSTPSMGSPFPITIGPEQAVAHHGWITARERALSVVLTGRGVVLVSGAPGTGKTLLLQEIACTLRAGGTDVLLLPRGDFVIDAAETEAANPGAGRHRVVVIDEADRMTAAALDHLARFGTRAFVLAVTHDPGDERPGTLATAAATVVRLAALPPGEVGAFVAARLAKSGLAKDVLTKDAVARLTEHSGGMPRVLNMLAGAALLLARADRAQRVEATHVDQAAALRGGLEQTNTPASGIPAGLSIVPCRQGEPPPSAKAPSAVPIASVQAPRRRWIAARGMMAGLAAACAVVVVTWCGDHASRTSLSTTAERQAPAASVPLVPAPRTDAVAAHLPATPMASARIAASALAPQATPVVSSSAILETAPQRAVASQRPEFKALPSGTPAHVLVRYARGTPNAAVWVAHVAATLRVAGLAVDALIPVAQSDAKPGARYFFAEDQATADAVLRAAGVAGKGTLTDAKGLNALLRPGLIELTVPPGEIQIGDRPQLSGNRRS